MFLHFYIFTFIKYTVEVEQETLSLKELEHGGVFLTTFAALLCYFYSVSASLDSVYTVERIQERWDRKQNVNMERKVEPTQTHRHSVPLLPFVWSSPWRVCSCQTQSRDTGRYKLRQRAAKLRPVRSPLNFLMW